MGIVGRGLVAAGLAVYVVIHAFQAVSGPESSPAWLTFMFGLTALVAAALAVGTFLLSNWKVPVVLGALLAGVSMLALVLSLTVGFLGVSEDEITSVTFGVIVAEVMVLLGAATALFGERFDLDEDSAIEQAAVENRMSGSDG